MSATASATASPPSTCATPKNPKVVDFIACPPGTRAFHLQTHEDLLLAVNAPSVWTMQEFQNEKAYFGGSPADKLKDRRADLPPGIRVYDISKPEKPAEIGFMPVDGLGPHRIWYTGGRYAYASIHFADFTDHILAVDRHVRPAQARRSSGRCWLPGMWRAGGETPTWPTGKRYALHHALVAGNIAYAAWRDGGLTVLDVADPDKAEAARLPQHGSAVRRRHALAAAAAGPQPAGPRRRADLRQLQRRAALHLDVRHPRAGAIRSASRPSRSPPRRTTAPRAAASARTICTKTGPARSRARSLIFATYYNAGVRAYDIENPFQPREVGYYVPPESDAA